MLALALFASAFAGCSRTGYLFPDNTGANGEGTYGPYSGTSYNDTYFNSGNAGFDGTTGYNGTALDNTANPQTATRLNSTTNTTDLPPVGTTNPPMVPNPNTTNTNASSQIASRLRQANIQDLSNMRVLTAEEIRSRLNLDPAMFEDYYFLDSNDNVGRVIYIVKVRNDSDKQTVRNAFQQRLNSINDATLATMPDKQAISRSGRIVENGNYIMLIASDRQDALVNSFNTLFA